MEYRDMAGNEITEGCYIVYAIRAGNRSDLKMGKVVSLEESETSYWNNKKSPILKVITLKPVLKSNDRWQTTYTDFQLQKNGKPIELAHLDNMYVITNIPDEVKKLLG